MPKNSSFEDGNPFDWPSSFPEFKELETVLGCGICFEYLSTAMMTKCSHNFCSLCIRRYICYKQQCPICMEPVFESDLRNNRIVDEIIQNFTHSRSRLLALMKSDCSHSNSVNSVISCVSKSSDQSVLITPKKSASDPVLKMFTMSTRSCADDTLITDVNGDSGVAVDADIVPNPLIDKCSVDEFIADEREMYEKNNLNDPTPGTSTDLDCSSCTSASVSGLLLSPSSSISLHSQEIIPIAASYFESASSKTNLGLQSSAAETVSCPVCNTDVPSRNINLHLDRCLEMEKNKDRPADSRPLKRKQMPKLVYTLLSDKELRRKLSSVGLPTNGNRQTLVKRHHEFTLMYNAQCDSLNPKSAQDIVNEIIQNESAKSRTPSVPAQSMSLKIDKHCSEEQVETAQKEYMKQHKTQFSELVAAARKNRSDVCRAAESSVTDIPQRSSASNIYDDDDDEFFCFVRSTSSKLPSPSASLGSNIVSASIINENKNSIDDQMVELEGRKTTEAELCAISMELQSDSVSDKKNVRPSRRVRRKLDKSTSNSAQEDCTASVNSADLETAQSPVMIRRMLRSCARKKKSSEKLVNKEMSEDYGDVISDNDRDAEDKDYEVAPSFSGRKRKLENHPKAQLKAKKAENNAENTEL